MNQIFTHGICEPHLNGVAAYGWYGVVDNKPFFGKGIYGVGVGMTGHVASMGAVMKALLALDDMGFYGNVEFWMPNQFVVNTLTGRYAIQSEHLIDLRDEIEQIASQQSSVSYRWTPKADQRMQRPVQMCHDAYDEYVKENELPKTPPVKPMTQKQREYLEDLILYLPDENEAKKIRATLPQLDIRQASDLIQRLK